MYARMIKNYDTKIISLQLIKINGKKIKIKKNNYDTKF